MRQASGHAWQLQRRVRPFAITDIRPANATSLNHDLYIPAVGRGRLASHEFEDTGTRHLHGG